MTKPIDVLIPDHVADELRAALAETLERVVDIVHGEHHAQIAQSVDRGVAVIRDDGRREEARQLKPAVAVRRAHHGDLDMLVAQPREHVRPILLDRGPPFQLKAEVTKEIDLPSRGPRRQFRRCPSV